MKKLMIAVLIIVLLVAGGVFFGRNILARLIIVKGIKQACGLKVEISGIDIRLPSVRISGLKVYNPSDFRDRVMLDIPEIYVDFDLPGFFKNKVYLHKLRLDIRKIDIVLNEQGKLNVNSLALLLPKSSGKKPPEVKIDELSVKIEKVVYRGYFPVVGVKSGEFDLRIDETFRNVTEPSKITRQLLERVLSRIGLSDLDNLKDAGKKKLKEELNEVTQEAVDKVTEKIKGLF